MKNKRRAKRQWCAKRMRNGHGEKKVWRRSSRAHSLRFLGRPTQFIVEIFAINDWTMQTRNVFSWLKKQITRSIFVSLMIYILTRTSISSAYPIFAQQGYENPREATGRIVCANCHLANKPVEIEVPQAFPSVVEEFWSIFPKYDLRNGWYKVLQPFINLENGNRSLILPLGTGARTTTPNVTHPPPRMAILLLVSWPQLLLVVIVRAQSLGGGSNSISRSSRKRTKSCLTASRTSGTFWPSAGAAFRSSRFSSRSSSVLSSKAEGADGACGSFGIIKFSIEPRSSDQIEYMIIKAQPKHQSQMIGFRLLFPGLSKIDFDFSGSPGSYRLVERPERERCFGGDVRPPAAFGQLKQEARKDIVEGSLSASRLKGSTSLTPWELAFRFASDLAFIPPPLPGFRLIVCYATEKESDCSGGFNKGGNKEGLRFCLSIRFDFTRAAKFSLSLGEGSMTALPIVETQSGDGWKCPIIARRAASMAPMLLRPNTIYKWDLHYEQAEKVDFEKEKGRPSCSPEKARCRRSLVKGTKLRAGTKLGMARFFINDAALPVSLLSLPLQQDMTLLVAIVAYLGADKMGGHGRSGVRASESLDPRPGAVAIQGRQRNNV
ncbi:putative two-component response regulator ARR22-like [Capsicum annuum]|nr:putative two-component response regulator ARR22-like [Capsicum annuum]KAF3648738.1 putative two-component response regulator ARR22-like [Capsicum annuum]